MRRKDRQVTDPAAVERIIAGCHVLRLGLADGDAPYIVPVNFAYSMEDGRLVFYIHGATDGRKYQLMRKNSRCSFEMDVSLGMDCMPDSGSVTMRYRSVMGTAAIDFLEGGEKRQALERLLARYPQTRDFPYNKVALARTAAAKLTVLTLTAKENPFPPGRGAASPVQMPDVKDL